MKNHSMNRRQFLGATSFLFLPLSACKAAPMTVTLDVVTFNYWNQPIFDVYIDGKGGDSSTAYPATGGSTISGVQLTLGPKQVSWVLDGGDRTPRVGEKIFARNSPTLQDVPPDALFLGLHIYPDETVELIPTRNYPRETAKGKAIASSKR